MANLNQVTQICGVLAAAYPNFQLQAETIKIYAEMLTDLDADALAKAAKMCMARCRFFPTIAELREATRDLSLSNAGLLTGIEAWGKVLKEVNRVHYDGTPHFEDPVIEKVVKSIGWREICLSPEVEILRAHFLKAYDQIAAAYARNEQLPPILRSEAYLLPANQPALPETSLQESVA